jgi:phosphatidylinositol alpha-1,6-mannosyltransferase
LWTNPPAKYLRAFERAALIIANSAYTVERAGTALPPGADVRICPLATYAEKEAETAKQRDGPPTVLLVGRVDELFGKGHDILIDVWPRVSAAVPNAKLVFVGGGPALDRLRRLVALSPVRHAIEIAGFVPDEAMDAYWRRASVFAMLGFGEGFGLVYADAMRHSLPVIASTDDAGQEVNVDGVTGYNVSRRDHKRLTEVLVELLRNPDRAHTLGQGALARWRENYTFTAFRSRLLKSTAEFLST